MKRRFFNSKSAYIGILLFGIVSLMGDVVYEGARGILPSYLKFLGASAVIVGLVGGLGDFLGYALRLISGFLVDTTHAYWFFIFLGYGLIVSIPLLGFSTSLEVAIILVLLERLGKAFRSPARDTVLSVISKGVGAGKAFGIHELLDQTGAIAGPLIVSALMFSSNNDYRYVFTFLLAPFLGLLTALICTYKGTRAKVMIEKRKTEEKKKNLSKQFYMYIFAVLLNTSGLIPFTLILYKASMILPAQEEWIIPLIYLLIQGVDASIALLAGYTYDKFGIKILLAPFLLSLLPPLLTISSTELLTLIIASIFFGLVLGMQESIYRAAVSDLTQISIRGTAYGIFNATYGIGFLISGGIYGLLMDLNAPFIVTLLLIVVVQATAVTILLQASKASRKQA